MSTYANRAKLGSRYPNRHKSSIHGRKADLLLANEENTKNQAAVENKVPVVSSEDEKEKYWKLFAVAASKYEHPVEDKVPPGIYYAEIKKMDIRLKNGQAILDVGYWIENNTGVYHILQSYYADSIPFKKLRKAIAAAGIDAKDDIRTAIGMSEKIYLAYVSKTSDVGSIIERIPCEKLPDVDENGNEIVPQEEQDDDAEFDDFLPDEE